VAWAHALDLTWQEARRGESRIAQIAVSRLLQDGALQGLSHLARGVDAVLVPRRVSVEEPLFVVAPPRSGTSLLFKLLEHDPCHVTPPLYQTLVPSVTLARALRGLGRLDTALGGWAGRRWSHAQERFFRDYDAVHRTRFDEAEEDTLTFARTLSCPSVTYMYPFPEHLRHTWSLDDRPRAEQDRVMAAYRAVVESHVTAARVDQPRFLMKNVFSAGRIGALERTFPGARFIHIARHPYDVIPSTAQMLMQSYCLGLPQAARPRPAMDPLCWRPVGELVINHLKRLLQHQRRLPEERWVTLDFRALVADPAASVEHAYARFGWTPTSAHLAAMQDAAAGKSRFRSSGSKPTLETFGWTRRQVYAAMPEVFEAWGFSPEH
jgi:hypothetical protein